MSEFSVSQTYDGGGTTNALQAAVDLDAVIALATQPTAIATGNYTGIELFLSVAADDKSPVVVAINHSSATISLTNIIHIQEDVVSAADMAFKVDRSVWGLTAATDHEPKRLVYFPCAPNSYVSIVCQSLDGSAVYCKYRLTQMQTAAAGGVGAAEGGAATEAKQDTAITSLQLIDNAVQSEGQTIVYADLPANATVAATAEEMIAANGANKFYIIELSLTFTVQDEVRLLDTSASPVYRGTWQVAQRGSIYLPRNANDRPHFVTTAGENIGIETAATNSYSGHIIYWNAT